MNYEHGCIVDCIGVIILWIRWQIHAVYYTSIMAYQITGNSIFVQQIAQTNFKRNAKLHRTDPTPCLDSLTVDDWMDDS